MKRQHESQNASFPVKRVKHACKEEQEDTSNEERNRINETMIDIVTRRGTEKSC
jgi:hypothetical protein